MWQWTIFAFVREYVILTVSIYALCTVQDTENESEWAAVVVNADSRLLCQVKSSCTNVGSNKACHRRAVCIYDRYKYRANVWKRTSRIAWLTVQPSPLHCTALMWCAPSVYSSCSLFILHTANDFHSTDYITKPRHIKCNEVERQPSDEIATKSQILETEQATRPRAPAAVGKGALAALKNAKMAMLCFMRTSYNTYMWWSSIERQWRSREGTGSHDPISTKEKALA